MPVTFPTTLAWICRSAGLCLTRNNLAKVLARSRNDLVARSIGVISATISPVSSSRSCSHRRSSDAYGHPSAYGGATVDAAAIDATVVNANASNSNASSICEGVC
jgi:hypothetical protein